MKSISSWKLFDAQPSEYQDDVLPPWIRPRLSLEASRSIGPEQYVYIDSAVIGHDMLMTGYGASGQGAGVLVSFGFTAENVQYAALSVLERVR